MPRANIFLIGLTLEMTRYMRYYVAGGLDVVWGFIGGVLTAIYLKFYANVFSVVGCR